jgi:hypothetical protein
MSYIHQILGCVSFYFSDLDGLKSALKQSKEIGGIKQVFLRKDLLLKVRQYDGILSNALQRFQVCRQFAIPVTLLTRRLKVTLALDARFAQLADKKGHMVYTLPISYHHNQLTSSPGHSKYTFWSLGLL